MQASGGGSVLPLPALRTEVPDPEGGREVHVEGVGNGRVRHAAAGRLAHAVAKRGGDARGASIHWDARGCRRVVGGEPLHGLDGRREPCARL